SRCWPSTRRAWSSRYAEPSLRPTCWSASRPRPSPCCREGPTAIRCCRWCSGAPSAGPATRRGRSPPSSRWRATCPSRRSVTRGDATVQAQVSRFRALLGLGRYDDARKVAERLLATSPRNADFLYQVAAVDMAQKQTVAAEKHLRAVLALDPKYVPALDDLG